jgi:hypothetical protein
MARKRNILLSYNLPLENCWFASLTGMMIVEDILSDEKLMVQRGSRKLLLTQHARERACQRKIAFNEIASAMKHAEREPADNNAWMYRWAGLIVIVDHDETVVLTVYPEPGYGIHVEKQGITREMQNQHQRDKKKLGDKSTWTSHFVAIVDQSGSMRATDIEENVTRSDMVWLNLAVTVVRNGIENGERKATDVLSVVEMKDDSEIVVFCEPFDWLLYNRLLDLMRNSVPGTGGRYIAALSTAEELFSMNRYKRCTLGLLFLSDGRPSDPKPKHSLPGYDGYVNLATEHVRKLASACGKRLSVWCIAIGGSESEDFSVLNAMVSTARDYECPAFFKPACLSSAALSTALRSLTTTVTSTMTTIAETCPHGLEYKKYEKMPQSELGAQYITDTWEVVKFKRVKKGHTIVKTEWTNEGWKPNRSVLQDQLADGLAFETRWFGEGKERLAKEMREVITATGQLVGPRMVAKSSILDIDDSHADFHKRFLKTQIKSEKFADLFNEALEKIAGVDTSTPRVEFLKCWVFMIHTKNNGRDGFLVEPMLDIQSFEYKKFNDNAGNIDSVGRKGGTRAYIGLPDTASDLPSIQEESEDEDDSPSQTFAPYDSFTDNDIPQAFSCFTFWKSQRKILVCDLQGILNTQLKPPRFQLTDPAIHSNRTDFIATSTSTAKKERYGRTDRGKAGIDDFFRSHKCSSLCRLVRARHYLKDESMPGIGMEQAPGCGEDIEYP